MIAFLPRSSYSTGNRTFHASPRCAPGRSYFPRNCKVRGAPDDRACQVLLDKMVPCRYQTINRARHASLRCAPGGTFFACNPGKAV